MAKEKTLPIPCPECGQTSLEPLHRIVENDILPCSLCGGLIDLDAEDCKPIVEKAKVLLNA